MIAGPVLPIHTFDAVLSETFAIPPDLNLKAKQVGMEITQTGCNIPNTYETTAPTLGVDADTRLLRFRRAQIAHRGLPEVSGDWFHHRYDCSRIGPPR